MAILKLLVANRGEIARRIFRTARGLGIRTVAVFSSADADAPHVREADEAVPIGPAKAAESYLSVQRIVEAAERVGADAVHPGYGFLSESPALADALEAAQILFVGPPRSAIELMGNKRAAKLRMQEAGVPVVAGYSGADQSDGVLVAEAERIGYPIMVKAAAGGGGRGMRLVADASDLPEALRAARAEAEAAFGSGELILERAVVRPRHVEVQVFGDRHGNVIHLGERDCSVQRRHQKVIEESPSPAVHPALRDAMGRAAVEAARAVDYVGAGTVEFLLDADGRFYFLEMNTRLQVEHPVTELVTGLDLVEWQLRVAEGHPLPLRQEDVALSGHAIEARLYAEDPNADFAPATGRIVGWDVAGGAGVRVDSGVERGFEVSPHYDPMLAKLVVYADTRAEACRKMSSALARTLLFGVVSNKTFLRHIVEHPVFQAGEATTAFLSDHLRESDAPPSLEELGIAAVVIALDSMAGVLDDPGYVGLRTGGPLWTTFMLSHRDGESGVRLFSERGDGVHPVFSVEPTGVEGEPGRVELLVRHLEPGRLDVEVAGILKRVRFLREGDEVWTDDGQVVRLVSDVTHRPVRGESEAGTGRVVAPLDGAVRAVRVAEGTAVQRGEALAIVEAMKMEHVIKADVDGTVGRVLVSVGTQVKTRQLLFTIEREEAS